MCSGGAPDGEGSELVFSSQRTPVLALLLKYKPQVLPHRHPHLSSITSSLVGKGAIFELQ